MPRNLHVFMYNACLEGIAFSEEYCWLEKYALQNLEIQWEVIFQTNQ